MKLVNRHTLMLAGLASSLSVPYLAHSPASAWDGICQWISAAVESGPNGDLTARVGDSYGSNSGSSGSYNSGSSGSSYNSGSSGSSYNSGSSDSSSDSSSGSGSSYYGSKKNNDSDSSSGSSYSSGSGSYGRSGRSSSDDSNSSSSGSRYSSGNDSSSDSSSSGSGYSSGSGGSNYSSGSGYSSGSDSSSGSSDSYGNSSKYSSGSDSYGNSSKYSSGSGSYGSKSSDSYSSGSGSYGSDSSSYGRGNDSSSYGSSSDSSYGSDSNSRGSSSSSKGFWGSWGQQSQQQEQRQPPPRNFAIQPLIGEKARDEFRKSHTPPVYRLEDVLRFDVSPTWVTSSWPRVSAGLSELDSHGYRVPLVSGTREDDVAGSLTYYFNKEQRVERVTFHGVTGDPARLVTLITSRFGLAREANNEPGVQLYREKWNGKQRSEMRIRQARVVRAESPNARYEVELAIRRPSGT